MLIQMQGIGRNDKVFQQVDPTHMAARVSLRPIEYADGLSGAKGGHYRIGAQTGTMAAGIASAASVFQVRWADPTKLFLLKRLLVQCCTGTGFAATTLGAPLELIVGHGSTANGSSGTAVSISPLSGRMRMDMAPSAFCASGEIRIASVGALTQPTGIALEATAIGECMGAPNATLAQSPLMSLYDLSDHGDHPQTLSQGDCLVVRTLNPAATGTWFACFTMSWAEVLAY